jgi:ABC-type glycerol-3-phosphate transport system permease component
MNLNRIRSFMAKIIEHNMTPYTVATIILFFMLLPIYWIIITSFKQATEVFLAPPTYIPQKPTFENYIFSLSVKGPILMYIRNSCIISILTTAIATFSATFTAYGLSQYKYKGSNFVLALYIFTRIIPPLSMLIPFYILFSYLGWINTLQSVIVYTIYMSYPLMVWMLKGFFDSFPRELIDAALIDGCSRTSTIFRVVLPVSATAIGAMAIISFMWSWNEFLAPLLFVHDDALKPITVGLYYFVGDEVTEWHRMSAAGVIAVLPSMIFFLLAQKYIIKGLTAGALKG